ncbi:hypothetical protein ACHAXA_000934 [Cyclostephanos tholiformis]|uniref:DNA polymerase alpha subunit B n=1 Tax=Cyclostephanos tholiformis TaxID=382380 RepID=A0ABD3RGL0_9STRA
MDDAATLKRSIVKAFVGSGHSASLPPDVLSGLAVLSSTLNLTPNRLAEAWEAHSLTRGVEGLDSSSFVGYRKMILASRGEQQQHQQHHQQQLHHQAKRTKTDNATVIGTSGLGRRVGPPIAGGVTPSPPAAKRGANGDKDGMSAVDGIVPSPDSPDRLRGEGTSAAAAITPPPNGDRGAMTSADAVVVAKRRYADRTNAGEIAATYDPAAAVDGGGGGNAADDERRKGVEGLGGKKRRAAISVLPPPSGVDVASAGGGRHMFAPLESRAFELERRLVDMDASIRAAYRIKDEDEEMLDALDGIVKVEATMHGMEDGTADDGGRGGYATWTPVGLPKQNSVLCVGRICNEAHEGRLNRASILLEGSRMHSLGSRIKLDLGGILHDGNDRDGDRGYSLFPGQIVAVEGNNPSGRAMRVSRVIEGILPPSTAFIDAAVVAPNDDDDNDDGDDERDDDLRALSIWTACGPYTTSDDLEYDPLLDLIERVVTESPDVVILCGPFVDGRQSLVMGEDGMGPTIVDDGENGDGVGRLVTPEQLFARKISSLLTEMYENDPDSKTQFVLIPSLDDAFVDAVYPQSPFVDDNDGRDGRFGDLGLREVEVAGRVGVRIADRPRRVHLASNPCTLRIEDVIVGVTSTDVLFHLASDGCDVGLPPGSRLARLAGHLVRQGSYYPLFPPAPGVPLDMTKSREWEIPIRPDVLIVPSRLAPFAKPVSYGNISNGMTLVVNPGELTKGSSGGTYARIGIRGVKTVYRGIGGRTTSTLVADGKAETSARGMPDRLRVEVRRI